MASKTMELTVPASKEICYKTLLKIGNNINRFKCKEEDSNQYKIMWKRSVSIGANSTKVEARFQSEGTDQTKLIIKCSIFQLLDLGGTINTTLSKFIEPFKEEINSISSK